MQTVSLDTFLRILTKGSPQKVQEFNKILTSSGYPFYLPLKDGAHAVTIGKEPLPQRLNAVIKVTSGIRQEYNVRALKALGSWQKKNKPESFFQAPGGAVTTPGGYLTVKLKPEFGAVLNGTRFLVHIWYSKDTSLSKTAVTLGNHLIQKHLCVGDFADCTAGILDLRKKELLDIQGNDQVMDLLISSEFAWIDNFFFAREAAAAAAA
jgi:hypothetical protein